MYVTRDAFTCTGCGVVYFAESTHEEAMADYRRRFPGWAEDDVVVLCTACAGGLAQLVVKRGVRVSFPNAQRYVD